MPTDNTNTAQTPTPPEVRGLDEQTLQEVTRAVTDSLRDPLAEIRQLQADLQRQQAEGRSPADPVVNDNERRLTDELQRANEINEGYRRQLAGGRTPAQPGTPGAAGGATGADWRGSFLRPDAARDLRQRHGSIMRAIQDLGWRDVSTALLSSGGQLTADQYDEFFDYVIEENVTFGVATVRRLMSPTGLIEDLVLGARKLRAATEGTAPSTLAGVTTSQRTLTTVETILPEDITLSFLEDNIERAGAEQHIARILATAFGNDSEDLGWNGDDTASVSDTDGAFLQINDGWITIAKADAAVQDADATSLTSTVLSVLAQSYKGMPSKYKYGTRRTFNHQFFAPVAFAENWVEELGSRAADQGIALIQNGVPVARYFGVPVLPITYLADDEMVLTPGMNLVYAVHRQLTIESEYQPRQRLVEYTLTARTDYEFRNPDAVVLTDNIDAAFLS